MNFGTFDYQNEARQCPSIQYLPFPFSEATRSREVQVRPAAQPSQRAARPSYGRKSNRHSGSQTADAPGAGGERWKELLHAREHEKSDFGERWLAGQARWKWETRLVHVCHSMWYLQRVGPFAFIVMCIIMKSFYMFNPWRVFFFSVQVTWNDPSF